jgi:hypothetical protein
LRHVFGAGDAQDRRFLRDHVVRDREQLKSGERSKNHVHAVALDQFLYFDFGAGGTASGIAGDQFDLPPRHLVVTVLQKQRDTLHHLAAALGEWAGLTHQSVI